MKLSTLIVAAAWFLLSSFALLAQDSSSFQVIVNTSNPASSIAKAQISKLFLKKVSKWDDGTKVQPVDQKAGSPVRDAFSKTIHNRSVSAIKNYWQQQIFSGRGQPPPVKASDAEVVDYVRANKGAIGYVSASAAVEGVKTVDVTQ